MLTQAQEQIIETTAPVVAEHLDAITQRFYPLMFERYPEVASLFNQAHQQDGGQPRALAGAILAYVKLRQTPETARQTLETVVNKHVSLDIQPDQYPIVGECLMAAIGEVLGEAVTPDVADAWTALYNELAGLLIELEEQRYQAFADRHGGWRGTRRFRIADTRQESRVIRSFILEPEDGGAVAEHAPGQFIGVKLEIDGKPVYRHYSLSDVPNGRSYRVSIKREPGGVASGYFHDRLDVGDTVELLPPAGELTLAQGEEPLLLVNCTPKVGHHPTFGVFLMAKYDESFKLRVIQQCLREDISQGEVARQYGVDVSTIRQWLATYRQHGVSGLRKKYSHHSAAFKREVLERMWRDGLSQRQAAALFDIRERSAIGRWERQYHSGGLTALEPQRKGRRPMSKKPPSPPLPDKERSQEALLKELAYLRAENAYLKSSMP